MSAQLKPLHVEAMEDLRKAMQETATKVQQRFRRQRMLEDEIVHHRPSYCEAMDIVDSLSTALDHRYGDLDQDLEGIFKKLKTALDEADCMQGANDPLDQYAGPEDEERE